MKRRISTIGLTALALLGASATTASAAPALRYSAETRGDFIVIGNALGHECSNQIPTPPPNGPNSILGMCGVTGLNDTAPDIYWSADTPMLGQATASITITAAQARSSAVLNIPANAFITKAYLYWGARTTANMADSSVVLSFNAGLDETVTSINSKTATIAADFFYQSVADITSIVQNHKSGSYRIGGIDIAPVVNVNNSNTFAGWWMVVFYDLDTEPPRSVRLFDGLDLVTPATPVSQPVDGFVVPPIIMGKHKLGVIAYEGDNQLNDDHLSFVDGADLTDPLNPDSNFFNGTRSYLGASATAMGDLPYLTGTGQSLSNFDIDVVDVTDKLVSNDKTGTVVATSTGDDFFFGGLISAIETFRPIFTTSVKSVEDLNGGGVLVGDVLEYTIVVTNTGTDASVMTVLDDEIPAGTTYVGGSLQISDGPNMGPLTDIILDDEGEYDLLNNAIKVRLGTGATGLQGGKLAVGQSTTVKFQVTINGNAMGVIENQGTVTASGEQGAPPTVNVTDSSPMVPGPQTTTVVIDQCGVDADCPMQTPHCDTAPNPNECVECLTDAHCPGTEPTCDVLTNTCVCIPTGIELCDGKDNNCNGTVDEGNPGGGLVCMTGNPGICAPGTTNCTGGSLECEGIAPGSQPEVCGDLIDEDCDGNLDNGCGDTDMDGLLDAIEIANGTDPNDADSDDDGVIDGDEPEFSADTDGDGLINALDPDSDNDGLTDGTELGLGCDNAATDADRGFCIADGDMGATKTDPLNPDTDGGGTSDGGEDTNLNGVVDAGETDPTAGKGADDSKNVDSDNDGLPDKLEIFLHSNPNDADTDDDGVSDGDEPNPSLDMDGDLAIDVLDSDSDNDGLFDGTEMGKDCSNKDTDPAKKQCVPDADGGATRTSPLDADTDNGGATDGTEDWNLNGAIDAGESDPTSGHGADDSPLVTPNNADDDMDGLGNKLEETLGSDPTDGDTDDDGVLDGKEPNPSADTDGDGTNNTLDKDSDGDGLLDGTELGFDCSGPGTDPAAKNCVPDGDKGATKTSPILADTDFGGVSDGVEDKDLDGVVDAGETDPTRGHGDDDAPVTCASDADCGNTMSGMVCDESTMACGPGCRGNGGNGCPADMVCTSQDNTIGQCVPPPACTVDADCGGAASGMVCDPTIGCIPGCRGANGNGCAEGQVCSSTTDTVGKCGPVPDTFFPEGGGLFCAAKPVGRSGGESLPWLVGLVVSAGFALRRRQRGSR